MSVVKSERSVSKLEVLIKMRDLCRYTVHIAKNEKNFPKRTRWILTSPIVKQAVDAYSCMRRSNSIHVTIARDYIDRRALQVEAYGYLEAMLSLIDIAYVELGIDSQVVEFWTGLILEVETLLQGWRKSDRARYGQLIKEES